MNNVVACVRSVYTYILVLVTMTLSIRWHGRTSVGPSTVASYPSHSFIPFCIYPVFAASSMQPFKVAFPANISIKSLGDVTSFSIYLSFEMRISENAKYDFKVRKLHRTFAISHMMEDPCVFATRYAI